MALRYTATASAETINVKPAKEQTKASGCLRSPNTTSPQPQCQDLMGTREQGWSDLDTPVQTVDEPIRNLSSANRCSDLT